jgi:Predicted permease
MDTSTLTGSDTRDTSASTPARNPHASALQAECRAPARAARRSPVRRAALWWALVLGFAISAIVQAWMPRKGIEALMSSSDARSVGWATGLGAASSCSYAAIAIAKSLFQKGASATAALADVQRDRQLEEGEPITLCVASNRPRVRGIRRGKRLLQQSVRL